MSRLGVLWFAVSALAISLAAGGSAQAFKSGGWEGEANNDENGKFRDCTMVAGYNSGITLAFVITRDFDWGLVLANDQWNLPVGSAQAVTLEIDARKPIHSTAKVVDAKGLLIPLENSDPIVSALRRGKRLTIVTNEGKVSFQLSGTSDAIAELAGCVSDHLEQEAARGGDTASSAF